MTSNEAVQVVRPVRALFRQTGQAQLLEVGLDVTDVPSLHGCHKFNPEVRSDEHTQHSV